MQESRRLLIVVTVELWGVLGQVLLCDITRVSTGHRSVFNVDRCCQGKGKDDRRYRRFSLLARDLVLVKDLLLFLLEGRDLLGLFLIFSKHAAC
jgi:hypothetical protein